MIQAVASAGASEGRLQGGWLVGVSEQRSGLQLQGAEGSRRERVKGQIPDGLATSLPIGGKPEVGVGAVVRSGAHLTPTGLRGWKVENDAWGHSWVPSLDGSLALTCPVQIGRSRAEAALELPAPVGAEDVVGTESGIWG